MTARRRILLVGVALVVSALLVVFALYNRGNPVVLRFGVATWRGEAVYALYAAIAVGLVTMFLAGLPGDLAARGGRRDWPRRPPADEEDPSADGSP